MPVLLQLNSVVNYSSTGRVVEGIGTAALMAGWKSFVAFGRHPRQTQSEPISMCNSLETMAHILFTRIADQHGLHSHRATSTLLTALDQIRPTIVHLHNIHGYYLNYPRLFAWLAEAHVPVVWTLHDCWAFTGHCCYFDRLGPAMSADCLKWVTGCTRCPLLHSYPASFGLDRSMTNWFQKSLAFNMTHRLHLVTPSEWLGKHVANSFLKRFPCTTIPYGLDLDAFRPCSDQPIPSSLVSVFRRCRGRRIILAVASKWDQRKGLDFVVALSKHVLSEEAVLVVVGLTPHQARGLPVDIVAIHRTDSTGDLAFLYSCATVFVNLSVADNFPVTNLEALACGTPVVAFDTGGNSEAVDADTGAILAKGDLEGVSGAIHAFFQRDRTETRTLCRQRAECRYEQGQQFTLYMKLYQQLLGTE